MDLTPMHIFGAGLFLLTLSVAGLGGWLQADWFVNPGSYPYQVWQGYGPSTWIGLLGFTFFCTTGVAFTVVAVTTGSRSRRIDLALRWNSVRVGLGLTFILIGALGLVWGEPMMKCLGAFCIGKDAYMEAVDNRPRAGDGWLVTVGTTAFFALMPVGMIMIRASWLALRIPAITSEGAADLTAGLMPEDEEAARDEHRGRANAPPAASGVRSAAAAGGGNSAVSFSSSAAKGAEHDVGGPYGSMSASPTQLANNNNNNNNNMTARPSRLANIGHQDITENAFEWKWFLFRTSGIAVALFAFFVTTLYIPNSWEYFDASRIASNAALVATINYTDCGDFYGMPWMCTDFPWAFFPTGNIIVTNSLVLKLYPGNLFFFAYLFLMLLGGAFMHSCSSKVGGFTRMRLLSFGGSIRYSYAEVVGWLLTVLMVTLFSIYWFHDHNFDTYGSPTNVGIAQSERVARGFGQLAVAFMGLLLFPSSRNSILHSTLGTSWESLLRVHRIFGYCMLICVIIHMVAWWVKYGEIGQFPGDIISVPLKIPSSADNFTVQLNTFTTWFMLICMGVLAFEPIRRRWFELFYYSHLVAAYASIPAILWHAAAGWEYLLPGLTVWFLDRLMRFSRSSRVVNVVSTKICDDGVTELRFQQQGLIVRPGQYVFINVAELSLLQWHPFTVSSVNNRTSTFSLHIKAMPSSDEGSKTWTQELRAIVAKGVPLTVSVDGPYGPVHEMSQFETVILVAGGIGVTPCAAIAENLRNKTNVRLELHWCLREPELASEFVSQLAQGENEDYGVTLYCTRPTVSLDELQRRSGGFTVKAGRPNWEELFSACVRSNNNNNNNNAWNQHEAGGISVTIDNNKSSSSATLQTRSGSSAKLGGGQQQTMRVASDPSKVLVFGCGPAQMIDECAKVAIEKGFVWHEETFFL